MPKKTKNKFTQEFIEFIKEFQIIGLAIAFVTGAAANDLVASFVDNIVMPMVEPLIPEGTWETASLALGPFNLHWGPFVSALLNFLIIMLVIFVVIKKILRYSEEQSAKFVKKK